MGHRKSIPPRYFAIPSSRSHQIKLHAIFPTNIHSVPSARNSSQKLSPNFRTVLPFLNRKPNRIDRIMPRVSGKIYEYNLGGRHWHRGSDSAGTERSLRKGDVFVGRVLVLLLDRFRLSIPQDRGALRKPSVARSVGIMADVIESRWFGEVFDNFLSTGESSSVHFGGAAFRGSYSYSFPA